MLKVAIMQPTYLPWLGYFALMHSVDKFVLLDTVQFSRRSWQQRNQIKTANGELMLTIPVISKGKRDQLIRDTKIDMERDFIENHIKAIIFNYKKAKYFKSYSDQIFDIMLLKHESLFLLTSELINLFKGFLSINTELIFASQFENVGVKDELLANLSGQVGASKFISPPGSKNYIENSKFFDGKNISIDYLKFTHPSYCQLYEPFLPNMSIIDLIFNCGPESLLIIENGLNN